MMYRSVQGAGRGRVDAVAVALFEKTTTLPAGYAELDKQVGGALSAAIKRSEFGTGRGVATCLYPPQGASRLYVLGLGAKEKFNADALRIAGAALVKAGWNARLDAVRVDVLPALEELSERAPKAEEVGRALGEGMEIARFDFDQFKGAVTKAKNNDKDRPTKLSVDLPAELRAGFNRGLTVGQAVNTTRELAATPPNVANPKYLADYCKSMSRRLGLKCTVIDAKRARELGMGGLIAVGQAGSTPPAMIVLEWPGKTAGRGGRGKARQPVLLVGKAITFDTGGYSLKINNGMLGMKYDKCGGMAVIGAMQAIATLKLDVPVVGIIAAAENMVDSTAFRPNDIITMVNGVTVEVTNTDAEGRLVLADALAYGCKTYNPAAVLDLATLTGGVVVALGSHCAGYFCTDDALRQRLQAAADASGDRLWELPLWDEHRDLMKGTHSDLVNSGAERGAHPIQGAAFLSYFATPAGDASKVGQLPWAHIDIAGTADNKNDTALMPKGPTGYGVRLLTRLLESWS